FCATRLISLRDTDEALKTSIIIFRHERTVNGGIAPRWTARREPGAPGSSSGGLPDMPQCVIRAEDESLQASILILAHDRIADIARACWLAQGVPGTPACIGRHLPDITERVVGAYREELQASIMFFINTLQRI